MATGYTHDIINGNITEFKDFALLCTRAFGATIHMRDEGLDTPYEPRKVSTYHSDAIVKNIDELKAVKAMSPEDYEKKLETKWTDVITRYQQSIEESKKNFELLSSMLDEARAFVPPTSEHENFKEFMIQQLVSTIDFDCNIDYYLREIKVIESKLESFNVEEERAEEIQSLEKSIAYHTRELNDEITRVKDSNKWMADLFKAFEQ